MTLQKLSKAFRGPENIASRSLGKLFSAFGGILRAGKASHGLPDPQNTLCTQYPEHSLEGSAHASKVRLARGSYLKVALGRIEALLAPGLRFGDPVE